MEETCHEDGGSSIECSWYENDLQLAAELGKTLLERNLELEDELRNALQTQNEQALEIDLLKRQLDVLKNVNESRMRMYEDVDHNSHELEKLNEHLMKEKKSDKGCIYSLTGTVKKLEERCEELQEQQELAMKENRERNRMREKRIRSVPSLLKMENNEHNFQNGYDYLGFPSLFGSSAAKYLNVRNPVTSEIQSLRENIKKLEVQLSIEQNKRKLAEAETLNVLEDNRMLEERFVNLVETKKVAVANKVVETVKPEGDKNQKKNSDAICGECGAPRRPTVRDKNELIEHDLDELPHGKVVRLKNGGSAYGSRESLHLIGLETDDTTPSLEVCSAILASDINDRMCQEEEEATKPSFSLLGELEEQYRKLVIRYETLVEAKSQRSPAKLDMATQDNLDKGQTRAGDVVRRPKDLSSIPDSLCRRSLDLSSPLNPLEGHFENGPPEYKRLFKEIFETLRRSVVIEDDQSSAAAAATATK